MSNDKTSSTTRFATVLVALAVVASVFTGSAAAATVNGSEGVVFLEPVDASTDSRTGVAVGVDAINATTNVTIDSVTLNGTTVSTNYTVEQGSIATISTLSGNNTDDTMYVDIADVPLQGSVDVTYSVNGSTYTDTVSYDIDVDGDGVSNSQDEYPYTAPNAVTHNATENETVESAYVEGSNGTFDAKVLANGSVVGSVDGASVGNTSEIVEIPVENGTYDTYTVEVEGNATIEETGLLYEATSGGASESPNGFGGLSDAQIGGIVVGIVGAGLLLVSRD